jgi:hypothetical protein
MDWELLFDASASKMRSRFEEIRAAINHRGLKGQANEEILREWLVQYLPGSLSVCTGEIIDSNGGRSKQADVVVFDTATTPRYFTSGDISVLPVETVYAIFEVKSFLNKHEIENAFANMRSVKSLKKTAYFPGTVTTTKFVYGQPFQRWPLQFFIFAFESDSLDTVFSHIQKLNEEQSIENRIDAVCVLDKGLIVNSGPEGLQPIPRPETQLIAKPSSKALLTFYAIISNLLGQAVSEPVCINPYLQHIKH